MTSYSTHEVCKLSGATFRQLDYWQRAGVLEPSIAMSTGSGTRRRWSFGDAVAARLLTKFSVDGGWKGSFLDGRGLSEAIALCRATTTPDAEAVLVIASDAAWLASERRPLAEALDRNEVVRLVAYDRLVAEVRAVGLSTGPPRRLDPWGANETGAHSR